MNSPKIVSRDEWLTSRRALLEKEKAFSKSRDALATARQGLPWVRVEEDYRFEGPNGQVALAELFGPHSQLIVYHFMFDPEWTEGCKICSLFGDHFDRLVPHLTGRDVSFVAISRADHTTLEAFRAQQGWSFPWVSSGSTPFNFDYHVSATEEDLARGQIEHNFRQTKPFGTEMPGLSVFARQDGEIFHTYSVYARGLEDFMGIYRFLDVVPNGRDEAELPFSMGWVKFRNDY